MNDIQLTHVFNLGFPFGMTKDVRTHVIGVLESRPHKALFLTELKARLPEVGSAEVARVVAELDNHLLLVTERHFPDAHLTGDLRIVALIDPGDQDAARRSAEVVWSQWVREILSHHRCG
ncbi:hypothetical protein [Streptomyces griseiscabiei]|uniref:Uncharacterized protein n=1 Tax=Streptomyces griseiscabiei TaxID=2993540 RepID=A0ABU4LG18_9ACTN|nr:hypothetical protein [Streptomyces griseiscabiei]MBZ3900385.1 hypothetical protein [Streptomyces griseiscabiei]MDX2914553.1 hypothetical protein [Streptomyces griseiscabiei]